MLLYFTNNSKQNKILIETDYAEDVLDEVLAFFEAYHIHPHFVKVETVDRNTYHYIRAEHQKYFEPVCRINFGSYSEFFYCEGILEIDELKTLFEKEMIF